MALDAGTTITSRCPVEGCDETVVIPITTYEDSSRPEARGVELYFDGQPLRDHIESHLIPDTPRGLLVRYLARNFTSVIARRDGNLGHTPSWADVADEIATLLGIDITDWD